MDIVTYWKLLKENTLDISFNQFIPFLHDLNTHNPIPIHILYEVYNAFILSFAQIEFQYVPSSPNYVKIILENRHFTLKELADAKVSPYIEQFVVASILLHITFIPPDYGPISFLYECISNIIKKLFNNTLPPIVNLQIISLYKVLKVHDRFDCNIQEYIDKIIAQNRLEFFSMSNHIYVHRFSFVENGFIPINTTYDNLITSTYDDSFLHNYLGYRDITKRFIKIRINVYDIKISKNKRKEASSYIDESFKDWMLQKCLDVMFCFIQKYGGKEYLSCYPRKNKNLFYLNGQSPYTYKRFLQYLKTKSILKDMSTDIDHIFYYVFLDILQEKLQQNQ